MEVITMEKKSFDLMMVRYDAFVQKVELLNTRQTASVWKSG